MDWLIDEPGEIREFQGSTLIDARDNVGDIQLIDWVSQYGLGHGYGDVESGTIQLLHASLGEQGPQGQRQTAPQAAQSDDRA